MTARRPAVMDTPLMLALAGVGALELVLATSGYDWHVTPLVRTDLTRPAIRDVVERAIGTGRLALAAIDTADQSQMDEWARWALIADEVEAEVIALALTRRWVAGLEDRQAQRALDHERMPGHWINAVNLLLDAMRAGVLLPARADALFSALDSYASYRARGLMTLADLLPQPLGLAPCSGPSRKPQSRGVLAASGMAS
jgi:hypothetical protein